MHRKAPEFVKIFAVIVLAAGLTGCWNSDVINTSLGDVSIGQQLLDLKTAFEQGALNEQEYEQARHRFLAMLEGCDCDDEDSDEERDEEE